MTNDKACTCPRCGVDISFTEKGAEYSNPQQQKAGQQVVCESLAELEAQMGEHFAYVQGFLDAMNQKIDSVQLQVVKQAVEKKE